MTNVSVSLKGSEGETGYEGIPGYQGVKVMIFYSLVLILHVKTPMDYVKFDLIILYVYSCF